MLALLVSSAASQLFMVHEEVEFLHWMRSTNCLYTGDEYHFRLGIYMSNARYVDDFNRQPGRTFDVTLNHLSAMTPTEYISMTSTERSHGSSARVFDGRGAPVTPAIDYRDLNVVSPVATQGVWPHGMPFASVVTVEGMNGLYKSEFKPMSIQMMMDCITPGKNVEEALNILLESKELGPGFVSAEEVYAYEGDRGECRFDATKAHGTVSELLTVNKTEAGLKELIGLVGPVCIMLDSGVSSFKLYQSGIWQDSTCSSTEVTSSYGCIGYGARGGEKYWIVKNHWGASWGEKGYIMIARDKGNMCGMATHVICAKP